MLRWIYKLMQNLFFFNRRVEVQLGGGEKSMSFLSTEVICIYIGKSFESVSVIYVLQICK